MQVNQQNEPAASVAETLSLTLRKPVSFGGKDYAAVTLREPVAGELEIASRAVSGVGALMSLIASTAQVPVGVAKAMCSRDLAEADAFFNGFTISPQDLGDGDDFVDQLEIPLRKPVTLGKADAATVYEALTMTEPTGGQKEQAAREPNDTRAAIVLISLVAKVPRAVVERLCRRDFEEACNFLGSCNVVGPTTGAM